MNHTILSKDTKAILVRLCAKNPSVKVASTAWDMLVVAALMLSYPLCPRLHDKYAAELAQMQVNNPQIHITL